MDKSTLPVDIHPLFQSNTSELELYKAIFANTMDAIAIIDVNGYYITQNKAHEDLVGYSDEDLEGQTPIIHFGEQAFQKIGAALATKGVCRGIYTSTTKSKAKKTIELNSFALYDEQGNIRCFVGIKRDITPLQNTLSQLKLQKSFLRKVIDTSPNLIFVKDQQSQYQLMNQAMSDMLTVNMNIDIDLTTDSVSLLPPDFQEKIEKQDQQVLAEQEQKVFEAQLKHPQTEENHWYQVIKTPISSLNGKEMQVLGVATDVTDLKTAKQKLQSKNQKLEQITAELKRSNEDLEQFAYVASHDLQEPLRMIISYLQLLSNRYTNQLNEEALTFMDFAIDGAQRMRKFIQGLLTYSRVQTQPKSFHPTNLSDIALIVQQNLQQQIKEQQVQLTMETLPIILADTTQMTSLLQNLIGNAIKFKHPNIPPIIKVNCQTVGNYWKISVLDNGIGISPDYLDKIFVIFQRLHTNEEYQGTGIGLAVCKKIVERHGGTIGVDSEVGKGSCFWFLLPKNH